MKILFIDVDGVLHPWPHNGNLFDASKFELVKQIVDATNAKLVLSSNWRMNSDSFETVKNKFHEHQMEIYDKTGPWLQNRAAEIMQWVAYHGPENYAILDDMADANIAGHFFQTVSAIGLTQEIADQVKRLLAQ